MRSSKTGENKKKDFFNKLLVKEIMLEKYEISFHILHLKLSKRWWKE